MYRTLTLAVLVMSFVMGCSKNENPVATTNTVYVGDSALFMCWITNYGGSIGGHAELFSDPIAGLPATMLKMTWGDHVAYWGCSIVPNYLRFVWNPDSSFHGIGDTVISVNLTSDVGYSNGTIKVPGDIVVTYPNQGDTIIASNPLTCTWTASNNVDWYSVEYYAVGYDTITFNQHVIPLIDTIITDTLLNIPALYFSSPNVSSFTCNLQVRPYTGSKTLPGSAGNMQGTINGYLIGEGILKNIYFYTKQ